MQIISSTPTVYKKYFLKNDFILRMHFKSFKNSGTDYYDFNPDIEEIATYLYQLSKLTNITKVHIIAYGREDIINSLDELDFYANAIWNCCRKRTILHIDRKQKCELKKAVKENPKLREYDSIQFQCDPKMVEFVNGNEKYTFSIDGTARIETTTTFDI